MYERDVGLIRSEKEALLRYMRESVVDNGEFLQRIRELEEERDELLRYKEAIKDTREGEKL